MSLAAAVAVAAAAGHDGDRGGLADQPLIGRDAWRAVGRVDGDADRRGVVRRRDRRPPVRLAAEVCPCSPRAATKGLGS